MLSDDLAERGHEQLDAILKTYEQTRTQAGAILGNLQGLVSASSRFEGGMGWGLHANEIVQAVSEQGIPTANVGGGCAAGGIAISSAWAMIASGQADVVAAVGAERMPKGLYGRSLLIVVVPLLISVWNMHTQADRILRSTIQEHLLSAARVLAHSVDAEPQTKLRHAHDNVIRDLDLAEDLARRDEAGAVDGERERRP